MPRLTINNELANSIYGSNGSAYFDDDGVARETNQIQIEDFVNERVVITDELTSDINVSTVGPLQSLRLQDGWSDDAAVTLADGQALWLEGFNDDDDSLTVNLAEGSTGAARVVLNDSFFNGTLESTDDDGVVTPLALEIGDDGELDTSSVNTGSISSASLESTINVGDSIDTLEIESQANTGNSDLFADDAALSTQLNLSGDNNDTLETVNITGVRNLTFNATSNLAALTAIDASAMQASASINTTDLGQGVAITGSDNGDRFELSGGDSLSAGAGNDRVFVGYNSLDTLGDIDGGDGYNTLRVTDFDGSDVDDLDDDGNINLSSINNVSNVDRITFYTEDNDVSVDASTLDNLAQIRFADGDPDSDGAEPVTNTDGVVIGNRNDLSATLNNADGTQRIDAIDGGDLTINTTEGTESLSIRANFRNDRSEEGETLTLQVNNADDDDSLSTLNLGGNGRIAYDASDDAEIATINATTLTGGLTLTGGDANLAETIVLAQIEEGYNGTGHDDITVDSRIGLDGDLVGTLTNFDVAEDTLRFGAIDGDDDNSNIITGDNVDAVDIGDVSSLANAFRAAANSGDLTEGNYASFSYEGDTYLYQNSNTGNSVTNGADSQDFALRMTGDVDVQQLADNTDQIVDIDDFNGVNDNTPVEETPVEETPVEETPVEETPVEETPVEETPTAPTQDGPDNDIAVSSADSPISGTANTRDDFVVADDGTSGGASIADFEDGTDFIDFSNVTASGDGSPVAFEDIAVAPSGEDTTLTYTPGGTGNEESITLTGVDSANIDSQDLIFA
ncbi:hypothetical protein [Kushneria sp. EE4]